MDKQILMTDIDASRITHLHQLRDAYKSLGKDVVAEKLNIPVKIANILHHSSLDGDIDLEELIKLSRKDLNEFIRDQEEVDEWEDWEDRQIKIDEANVKNELLILDLAKQREVFAGIGTNKAKRRLNKLSLISPIAKAVRVALEIEDKSISAKNSYGDYQNRIYNQKSKLIMDLVALFKEQDWIYGVQNSEIPPVSHVIYFEIPDCEQISWHFSADNHKFPKYKKPWDKKINSTLAKLEVVAKQLLEEKLKKEESK